MLCLQNAIGEMGIYSQFLSPKDLTRWILDHAEVAVMPLATQEKPRIAGSLSEASFRSARGMKSSDSVLPADVAILADQVESFERGLDGLFVFGYSVLIDASSLIGESKPIVVTPENPVLVAGTKVLDGQCTMMVTRVGMTIEHESLMGYIQVLRNRLGQNTIDYKALVCFVAACRTMVINSNSLFVTVPLDEASVKHLQVTSSDFAGEGLGTWCLGYMELDKEFSAEDPIPTSEYTCIGIVGTTIPPGIKESVAICRSAGINGGATERTNWVLCPC
ncbi:PREDICTED: calcium-transporting ATPase 2, plasma membrane-type-like isoform 2 [Fragaria vesca subsp. vesca]